MSDLQNQIDAAIQAHEAGDADQEKKLTDALSAAQKAKDDLAAAEKADATEDAAYQAKIDDLQARLDALTKPAATTLFGQNFDGDGEIGEANAQVARVYFRTVNATEWANNKGVKRALVNKNVKIIMVSYKDQNETNVRTFFDSIKKSLASAGRTDIKILMIIHHEPENNATKRVPDPAHPGQTKVVQAMPGDPEYVAWSKTWKGLQAKFGPIAREYGFFPTFMDMAWTLYAGSKRDPADWTPPKGSVDYVGFDNYYHNFDPLETLNRAADFAQAMGLPLVIGETGCQATDTSPVDKTKKYRQACIDRKVVAACFWSMQLAGQTYNGHWSDAMMKAWYALA